MKNSASFWQMILSLFFLLPSFLFSQISINENGNLPDPSAILDVQSTDKGALFPRMTTAERQLVSNPANGLLVFDTDTQSFWYFDQDHWEEILADLIEASNLFESVPVANFSCLSQWNIHNLGGNPTAFDRQDDYVYIVDAATSSRLLKVFDMSNPDTLIEKGSIGTGPEPEDVVVQGDYAYVIDRLSGDLSVIDISNHANMSVKSTLNIGFDLRKVQVQGDFAYVLDWGTYKLTVVDVSNPDSVFKRSSKGLGSSAGYFILQDTLAYVLNNNGDLFQIVDISNPNNLAIIGSLGIGHDPRGVAIQGNYAYVVDHLDDDLRVIDISDPLNPTEEASLDIRDEPFAVAVQDHYLYIVNRVGSYLQIVDIRDPLQPSFLTEIKLGAKLINVDVEGNYAYTLDDGNRFRTIQLTCTDPYFLSYNSLTNGFDLIPSPDSQTIQLSGTSLSIKNGNTIDLEVLQDDMGDHTASTNIQLNGQWISRDGDNEGIFVRANGNVGIGTSSPDWALHVKDSQSDFEEFIVKIENTANNNSARNEGLLVRAGHTSHNSSAESSFIQFETPSGSYCGRIRQSGGTAVEYVSASDRRLKENIRPTQYGLADLMKIQVRDYNYKVDEASQVQTGFIAQQLYTAYPPAVGVGGENPETHPWEVAYGSLTPLLVQAIQEQQKMIEYQRVLIQELQSQVQLYISQ